MSTDPKDPKDPVPDSFKDLLSPTGSRSSSTGPGTSSGSEPTESDSEASPPFVLSEGEREPESPPFVLSEGERERDRVEGPITDEPAPPTAPTTATFGDLQAAVGVTPSAPLSTTTSGPISAVSHFPSPSASPSRPSPSPPSPSPSPSPPPPRRAPARTFSDADDSSDDDTTPRKRKWPIVLALAALLAALIGAFILLGNANSQRYYLVCSAKYITAEQGNSFPPWGTSRITGAAWKPIAIPPNAECTPQSTDSITQLESLYLDALISQSTTKLSGSVPGDIDEAESQLNQAMLLTRSPERRDQRKELERLLGDVTYWRAAAKVKSASQELEEAAKRFDEAATKRPRHASDASEWATFVRSTASALTAGPSGSGAPQLPPSGVPLPTREPAPPGVALPIEMPSPASASDAGVPDIDAAASNLPSGGVLM